MRPDSKTHRDDGKASANDWKTQSTDTERPSVKLALMGANPNEAGVGFQRKRLMRGSLAPLSPPGAESDILAAEDLTC